MSKAAFLYSENLELRADSQGMKVVGPVVRYDDKYVIGDFTERIERGAFQWNDVFATIQHDRRRLIGRTGSNLQLRDEPEGLYAELRMLDTRDALDAKAMLQAGLLKGWSAEFDISDDRFDGFDRVVTRADLKGVSLVDVPAYSQSLAEIQTRWEKRAQGIRAKYQYGQTETIADTGRNRKRRIRPNAFKTSLDDPEQEITLSVSRNPNDSVASKLDGTLTLRDTESGLEIYVDKAAETAAFSDLRERIKAGMKMHVVPYFREVDGEYRDIPEPGNESVSIREYSSVKLYALGLIARQPKGAESQVDLLDEARAVWAESTIY